MTQVISALNEFRDIGAPDVSPDAGPVYAKGTDLYGPDGNILPVGVTAASLVSPTTQLAGTYTAPALVGPSLLPPPTFYPKKRFLGAFTTAAAAQTTLTGGATKSDDTTDPASGNQSAGTYPNNMGTSPIITLGSGGAATAIPSATALAAQDLTGTNVYAYFKVLDGGANGPGSVTAGIRLYTGTTVNSGGANYLTATVTNWNPTLEWQILGFAIEDFAAVGTATLGDITAITHAGLRLGGVTVSTQIELGGFFVCPKQAAKGLVVIGFDDCRADTWTDAAYELIKRGFPGTLFPGAINAVLRSSVDQFQMNVSQLQKLNRIHGWQVASQAWDTESPAYSGDQAVAAMSQQRALWAGLRTTGGIDGSYFSNLGPHVTGWKPAFKENFRLMRGFNIGSSGAITAKQVLPETFPIADPNYVRALGVDLNANTTADLTNFAGYAAASKSLAIFVFHGVTASNSTQFAKFTALLDYLDANRATLEVCVLDRAVQYGYAFPV